MIEVGGIGSEKLYSVEIEWLQESFGSHHNFIDCEPVFVDHPPSRQLLLVFHESGELQ